MRNTVNLSDLLCLVSALSMGCAPAFEAPPDVSADVDAGIENGVEKIHYGTPVGVCGWPTTVSTGGCTAALIHARAISTAQHCGAPTRVTFGESRTGARSVRVVRCVGQGSSDAQICELAEAVTDIPITPLLFGCETGKYLQPNRDVVVAGFGRREDGGSGRKDWAYQSITKVTSSSIIVAARSGERSNLCNGDSGGPAFVRVDDGSWRVIGTVRGLYSGPICQGETEFKRTDPVVANFESQTGIDITPCFNSGTGAWSPGAGCGGFFAGDHRGSGLWSNGCSGTSKTGYSAQCGAPFGGVVTSCHVGAPGNSSYCTDSCPCDEGEGDCDGKTQCKANLICQEQGTVDRCVRDSGGTCRDSNANCSSWARRGECSKNPGYMLTNCCASCNGK